MSEFPYWYCPIFACPYRTSYSKNIRKHLSGVHGWVSEDIDNVVESFFEAYEHNRKVVCGKSPSDPCYPSEFNEPLVVPAVEGREAKRSEADRSVSVRFVGGGGGE